MLDSKLYLFMLFFLDKFISLPVRDPEFVTPRCWEEVIYNQR